MPTVGTGEARPRPDLATERCSLFGDSCVNPRRIPGTVRSPLGRDARNPMTRMGPPPRVFGPTAPGFGMGSVGEGGSVDSGETPRASSA